MKDEPTKIEVKKEELRETRFPLMEEDTSIEARQEIVFCVYKGGEFVAIVKKNGENLLYGVEKLDFDSIGELLNSRPTML